MDAPAEWNNMERWSGVRRAGAALAVVLMAGALALVVFQGHAAASQPVALESAILPPAAFRRWVYGATHQDAPRNEIPLDRLAGRGRGAAVPTEVPGYYEKELKAAKQKYFEVHNEVAPKLVEVQENILKEGETPELLQEEADLKEALIDAKKPWNAVQRKINQLNKEVVHGTTHARFGGDSILGTSDHFVPASQTARQLDGQGYGKKWSLVDWMTGDD